jgi:ABC-type glycerol-3-phosphate transport system substrate-binding protein
MALSGSWELNTVKKNNAFLGVTAPPKGPGGQATLANTDIMSINRDTKHPEEAWTFLKWFYGREVQREFMLRCGLQPARLSLGLAWTQAVRDLFRKDNAQIPENLTAFVTNSAFATPQPFFADPNVIGDITPAITKAIKGEAPIPTTLISMANVVNQKLKALKK